MTMDTQDNIYLQHVYKKKNSTGRSYIKRTVNNLNLNKTGKIEN